MCELKFKEYCPLELKKNHYILKIKGKMQKNIKNDLLKNAIIYNINWLPLHAE